MEIRKLIETGKLAEARQQLVAAVKASPADQVSRTLLFQVLCYCGEWEKAARHLEIITAREAGRGAGVLGYRGVLSAEMERSAVFNRERRASFVSEPPRYFEIFLKIREALHMQNEDDVKALLQELEPLRPIVRGTVNGTPFTGFCDTDTSLFPFLEVFAHDRYLWIPFESIREFSVSKPDSFLDLLWAAGRVTTWEGLTMNCIFPVLYPNSHLHEDVRIRMGRMTDWKPLAGGFSQGLGQHVYNVGGSEMAILELTDVVFSYPGEEERYEETS